MKLVTGVCCASMLLTLVACSSDGVSGVDDGTDTDGSASVGPPGPLVVMDAWQDEGVPDPQEAHRPDPSECSAGAWGLEGATLEVDTGSCDFLSVRQPLLTDLTVGDPLELVFWHTWLTAEEPAEGHLALFVDGELLYERSIAIPADPSSYTEAFDSPVEAAAGTSVTIHLHNHGANTWNVLRLERVESP